MYVCLCVENDCDAVYILLQIFVYSLGVTKHEAQQWCLAHAFELVELNPQELPDEDGEFSKKITITVNLYFFL